MEAIYLLAIDLGKRHFQVCGTDVSGKVLTGAGHEHGEQGLDGAVKVEIEIPRSGV